jgi:hypothetical protein
VNRRNNFLVVFLVIAMLGFGYFQEFVKVNINYHLDLIGMIDHYDSLEKVDRLAEGERLRVAVPYDYYHSHQRIDFLFDLEQKQVVMLKWISAAAFILMHFAVCWIILSLLYGRSPYHRWLIYIYGAVSIGVVLSYLLASFTQSAPIYQISRKMLSFIQSILPLMLIYPVVLLKRRMS